MFNKLKRRVSMDVLDNKAQYLLIVFFLIVGITAGTFTLGNMKHSAKTELSEYISYLFITLKNQSIDYFGIFIHSFLRNTLIFGTVTLFSMFMIGIPVIIAVLIIKGFCVGFTVGVLSLNFGSGGLLAIIFCTFITNLILLPCVCKAGVLGLNNSLTIFKNRKIPKTSKDKLIASQPHLNKMFRVYLVSLVGVLLEMLVSPALMKM